MSALLEFSYSTRAIAGARPYQEDTCRVWRPSASSDNGRPLLAVLADGMGGHVSGEIASRIAAEQYINVFSSEHGSVDQRLEHALYAGNDAILTAISKEKSLNGMGCTLVASYIDQDGLRWTSVGDSLLLLFRGHTLIRKNENHSLGALLDMHAEANVISHEEAKNSPRRHTLRSALTGAPIPLKQVERRAHPLQHGDWILMASDGLESLSGDTIAQIISEREEEAPSDIALALLNRVTAEGLPNQDNTSVIVIRVQDPTLAPTRIVRQQHDDAGFLAQTRPESSPSTVARKPNPMHATGARAALVAAVGGLLGVAVGWLVLGGDGEKQASAPKPASTQETTSGGKESVKSPQDATPNQEKPPSHRKKKQAATVTPIPAGKAESTSGLAKRDAGQAPSQQQVPLGTDARGSSGRQTSTSPPGIGPAGDAPRGKVQ